MWVRQLVYWCWPMYTGIDQFWLVPNQPMKVNISFELSSTSQSGLFLKPGMQASQASTQYSWENNNIRNDHILTRKPNFTLLLIFFCFSFFLFGQEYYFTIDLLRHLNVHLQGLGRQSFRSICQNVWCPTTPWFQISL